MNPWDWMGDGCALKESLNKFRYEIVSQFIYEDGKPSHSDGLQLQGGLNLLDNYEEDGGFICVPKFHLKFDEYFQSKKPSPETKTMYRFSNEDPYYHKAVRIPMRAGSICIWDQRLPHGSRGNSSSRPRCAQFIKMFRRSSFSSSERVAARAVSLKQQLLKLKPGTFQLTELGKKLFGLE
jgi:ectoine hydroxylase-related dioxygenase (phytanoyl-CoA dioxygenase family)